MHNVIKRVEFTKEMRKTYKILAPNMLPIHFSMIADLFNNNGYNVEILQNSGNDVVQTGLKYVHNDTCYPALLVIGQLINALESGLYDTHKVALLISQTGGGCRASNYIHLLRKALVKAGFEYVPVISLNVSGMERNEGFKLTVPLLRKTLAIIAYGDLLMLLKNQIIPYEVNAGEAEKLVKSWRDELTLEFGKNKGLSFKDMNRNFGKIVNDFSKIKIEKTEKLKVGIVGEIYVKYSSLGNNSLEEFLLSQNCEYMIPGLVGFMMFKTDNRLEDIKLYGGTFLRQKIVSAMFNYLEKVETALINAVNASGKFVPPGSFKHLKHLIHGVVGYGNKMGEGWLLPAEMIELCTQGYGNIVCTQPFGCLPNHIVGKGTFRTLKERYPDINVTAIDYDPGAAKVNQENRIKLMLAVARDIENNKKKKASSDI